MVCRGYSVLLDELRCRKICPELKDTATILYPVWSARYKFKRFMGVVNSISKAGSHYKNIGKALGPGTWFVLGKVIPETV